LGALTITLDADQVKISELRLYPGADHPPAVAGLRGHGRH
jgi:hypothetical protein